MVLHPLTGVAGHRVEVEHVDGTLETAKFPEQVNPVQPFLHIRALTHEVRPGLKATVRMEGDAWEMEDHRNWTDASFKTYVRPLALPWPYTLKAGEAVKQSVTLKLSGSAPKAGKSGRARTVEVKLGAATAQAMPAVGLGMPAEEIDAAIAQLDLLKLAAPRLLICHFDPRRKHDKQAVVRLPRAVRADRRAVRAGDRGGEPRTTAGKSWRTSLRWCAKRGSRSRRWPCARWGT